MDYLIQTKKRATLDLSHLGKVVLKAANEILGIKTKHFEPILLSGDWKGPSATEMYTIGRLLFGGGSCDSVLAYHIKGPSVTRRTLALNPCLREKVEALNLYPDWALEVGISLTTPHGIDISPDRRLNFDVQANEIGKDIKKYVDCIERIVYINFSQMSNPSLVEI